MLWHRSDVVCTRVIPALEELTSLKSSRIPDLVSCLQNNPVTFYMTASSICGYWHPSRGKAWLPMDPPLKTEGLQPHEARASKTEAGGRQSCVHSSASLGMQSSGLHGDLMLQKHPQKRARAEVRPASSEEGARASLEVSLAQQHLSHGPAGQLSFLQDDSCAA